VDRLPASLHRLIAASGLSNLADGVFQVALPLVTLGITRDPAAFASVTVASRLPWLLFALPAGALADRLDRRRTMLLVSFARAALIGLLAAVVAADWERLWVLYLVAFALGTLETLFDTAAQSILPNLLDDHEQLDRANGRLQAVELTANQFVGPPLGGVLVAASAVAALAGSSGAYLLAAVCLLFLAGRFRPERTGPPTNLRTDIAEGVRYLARHRALRTLALCVGLSNLSFTATFAVFPIFAVAPGPMGLSERGFGLLLVAFAVGSVSAAPLVAPIERRIGRWRALLWSVVAFPLPLLVPAVTSAVAPFALAAAVSGFSIIVWNVITVSFRQRIVPDHLLGRVNSGYRLLAWGTMPLGAALGGVLGEVIGLRATFAVCAGLGWLCVPLLLAGMRPGDLAAVPGTAAPVVDAAAT
jgi:MFS family permease